MIEIGTDKTLILLQVGTAFSTNRNASFVSASLPFQIKLLVIAHMVGMALAITIIVLCSKSQYSSMPVSVTYPGKYQ